MWLAWPNPPILGSYVSADTAPSSVAKIFYCPLLLQTPVGSSNQNTGIAYNSNIATYNNRNGAYIAAKITQIRQPQKTLILIDSAYSLCFTSFDITRQWGQGPRYDHNYMCNMVYVTGNSGNSIDLMDDYNQGLLKRDVQ